MYHKVGGKEAFGKLMGLIAEKVVRENEEENSSRRGLLKLIETVLKG